MDLTIGTDILRDFEAASAREWLTTNGLGGYASASLSGANTRRYHGLLVAALTPPTGRMTLLSRLEETLTLDGESRELAANRYPGAIHPQGYGCLEAFRPDPAPTFRYRPRPDVLLEKRIWMAHGRNTTYVQYHLVEAPASVALKLTPLVCWKDYHSEMHPWPGFPAGLRVAPGEVGVCATDDAPELRLIAPGTGWEPAGYWHYDIVHSRELERGFDGHEDLYCPGHFLATLAPGQSLTLTATLEPDPADPMAAWEAHLVRRAELLARADVEDDFERALVLAADQFVIEGTPETGGNREIASGGPSQNTHPGATIDNDQLTTDNKQLTTNHAPRSTIIAGYHWFADWGRDTMIALPGLCLSTGRAAIAADILRSFAGHVSEGMLPNRFPDRGETPEYNTVDATLWYFQALWETQSRVADGGALVRDLWPVLEEIVAWHVRGTRYGIGVDPEDGLLRAGEPGVQLTWMDARVGDWVVTPRIGKPVEINALWYNALRIMEALAEHVGADPAAYKRRAAQVGRRFRSAFVRLDGDGLYDVVGAGGPDVSIRPNQIFAVSLPFTPLIRREQRAVVDTVARELLTPYGLRTLAPSDPAYRPHYAGGPVERDGAYHQGTVWPWLLGAFVEAHLRVYGDRSRARAFLEPLQAHLREAGIGTISEILDADPPHAPNGCIAQAWSVGEVLRAWKFTS